MKPRATKKKNGISVFMVAWYIYKINHQNQKQCRTQVAHFR